MITSSSTASNHNQIAPAIRELVALGFIQVTHKGCAGNAKYRQPTLFLLTYRPFGSHKYVGNGWRRIGDIEEAEAVANAARAKKADARAREFGRKGGLASRAKKQNPSHGNRSDVSPESGLKQSGKRIEMRPENCLILSPETGAPLEFPVGGPSGSTEATTRRHRPSRQCPSPGRCPSLTCSPRKAQTTLTPGCCSTCVRRRLPKS